MPEWSALKGLERDLQETVDRALGWHRGMLKLSALKAAEWHLLGTADRAFGEHRVLLELLTLKSVARYLKSMTNRWVIDVERSW